MKLSNKFRPISKEYQINSTHQTVEKFESKLILIKRYYIITLPFAKTVFKIIVLKFKIQRQPENKLNKCSICRQNDHRNKSSKN